MFSFSSFWFDLISYSCSSEDEDGEGEGEGEMANLTAQDASKKHIEYDNKHKQVVRDMRIREDIAYYLRDIENEHFGESSICESWSVDVKMARDNYRGSISVSDSVRASDEVQNFKETQLFAWESTAKGNNLHIEAQPTATGNTINNNYHSL